MMCNLLYLHCTMKTSHKLKKKAGEDMPMTEKEYNGNLLDQLTLLERIEILAKKDNAIDTLSQIEFEKKCINRKLYQKPPLTDSNS